MGTAERNISSLDYYRLMNLLNEGVGQTKIPADSLHQLYVMLKRAHKIKSEEIPANIVTMNSEVVIRYVISGKTKTFRIVYPYDGEMMDDKECIPVYNPLALSVLGLHEHDMSYSRDGIAEEPLVVDKILYQPEAHKKFDL
jgi:regulator of nucleoside diphosphate kinase